MFSKVLGHHKPPEQVQLFDMAEPHSFSIYFCSMYLIVVVSHFKKVSSGLIPQNRYGKGEQETAGMQVNLLLLILHWGVCTV